MKLIIDFITFSRRKVAARGNGGRRGRVHVIEELGQKLRRGLPLWKLGVPEKSVALDLPRVDQGEKFFLKDDLCAALLVDVVPSGHGDQDRRVGLSGNRNFSREGKWKAPEFGSESVLLTEKVSGELGRGSRGLPADPVVANQQGEDLEEAPLEAVLPLFSGHFPFLTEVENGAELFEADGDLDIFHQRLRREAPDLFQGRAAKDEGLVTKDGTAKSGAELIEHLNEEQVRSRVREPLSEAEGRAVWSLGYGGQDVFHPVGCAGGIGVNDRDEVWTSLMEGLFTTMGDLMTATERGGMVNLRVWMVGVVGGENEEGVGKAIAFKQLRKLLGRIEVA